MRAATTAGSGWSDSRERSARAIRSVQLGVGGVRRAASAVLAHDVSGGVERSVVAQGRQRAAGVGADGGARRAQHVGDLRVVEPFVVAQHQDGALPRRQVGEASPHRVVLDDVLGVVRLRGRAGGEDVVGRGVDGAHVPPPAPRQVLVGHHPPQVQVGPRHQRDARPAHVRAQQHLLDEVGRDVPVACEDRRVPQQAGQVVADHVVEPSGDGLGAVPGRRRGVGTRAAARSVRDRGTVRPARRVPRRHRRTTARRPSSAAVRIVCRADTGPGNRAEGRGSDGAGSRRPRPPHDGVGVDPAGQDPHLHRVAQRARRSRAG